MYLLENVIQPYAWGSTTALPSLLGTAPTGGPQAELWMGAHPLAPSKVHVGGAVRTLDSLISERPEQMLGAQVSRRFEAKLPFLLKVLAAAEPLSLQAHPSLEQARRGFEAEERGGIPRDAPHRNYKDANHKPELLCALTPFVALCGFRRPQVLVRLWRALGAPSLTWAIAKLEAHPDERGLREVFERLLSLESSERERAVREVTAACATYESREDEFADGCRWAVKLAALHPTDAGVVTSLMLNVLRLAPGEAIHLPAGNLHAYLDGTGIELMASSDNVLRGGLTKKHVDVAELVSVLDFTPREIVPLRPERVGPSQVYRTPAPEFRLSRVDLEGSLRLPVPGPAIMLSIEGDCVLSRERELTLSQGQSVFLPASTEALTVSGAGVLFVATLNWDEEQAA